MNDMNLSNFKMLKEDSDSYHIQHPNGKPMRLKKGQLSQQSHEMIRKMCNGGMYAEGGDVVPNSLMPQDQYEQQQMATPDGMEQPQDSGVSNQQPPSQVANNQIFNQAPVQSSGENPGIAPADQQPAKSFAPEDIPDAKSGSMRNAMELEKQGNTDIANAQAGQAATEAKYLKDMDANVKPLQQAYQDTIKNFKAKNEDLLKAYQDKKIDPDRLWHNMSTGSKIMAGISMIFGGIGNGLTHSNAPLAMEQAIDRDIAAQKADQEKGMNLYKMNREVLGDDLSANLATQNQYYTGIKYKLMQAASQSGSAVAQARAKMANGLIDQKLSDNEQQLAALHIGLGKGTGGNGASGKYSADDPSMLVPRLVPEGQRQKVFDEIEAAQNTKANASAIMDAYDNAVKEQTLFSKNAIPGVHSPYIDKLHALLGPTFKDVEGTVRQAAMDNLYASINPQIGSGKERDSVQRQALEHYLTYKSSAPTAKGHGIDLTKFRSTSPPEIGQIKTMNGVQYRQVNGGWQKVGE